MNELARPDLSFRGFLAYLENEGVLAAEARARAVNAHATMAYPADTVLVELGLVKEAELARHLSAYLGVPYLADLPDEPDASILDPASLEFLEANHLVPLERRDGLLVAAVADPFEHGAMTALGFHFDLPVSPRIFPRSAITDYLKGLREREKPAETLDAGDEFGLADSDDLDRLRDYAREAPVVRFVSRIIQQAVDDGATDIHVEPMADHVRIRFRIDGMMREIERATREMHAGISTRIKIMSRLNIAERRLPQDGRMRIAVRGQNIDLRVSVMPSAHGETFVLRILDRSGVALSLDALGYAEDAIDALRHLVKIPNGIVLICGPTGSGKTTTLYSLLKERQGEDIKIFTVEDPIEYRLDGVTQLQVDPAIDLDFARALRSVLRQDPDVILVGEIRDRESAQIAIQAALTGHLVLSTLHTNTAAGALTRLQDMGIDPYLISATLRASVAQRLLRKSCGRCGGSGTSEGEACKTCHGAGYSGRTVTYEILTMSPQLAASVNKGGSEQQLRQLARAEGAVSMHRHADRLVERGITSREEVGRVLEFEGDEG
ncbi:MAG: type II/IV secretion system protein [Nitratireductor sp.]|nr:type II/IV secretion system protein [Nitratireductor sp.]